jgi:hypothetical protein
MTQSVGATAPNSPRRRESKNQKSKVRNPPASPPPKTVQYAPVRAGPLRTLTMRYANEHYLDRVPHLGLIDCSVLVNRFGLRDEGTSLRPPLETVVANFDIRPPGLREWDFWICLYPEQVFLFWNTSCTPNCSHSYVRGSFMVCITCGNSHSRGYAGISPAGRPAMVMFCGRPKGS